PLTTTAPDPRASPSHLISRSLARHRPRPARITNVARQGATSPSTVGGAPDVRRTGDAASRKKRRKSCSYVCTCVDYSRHGIGRACGGPGCEAEISPVVTSEWADIMGPAQGIFGTVVAAPP